MDWCQSGTYEGKKTKIKIHWVSSDFLKCHRNFHVNQNCVYQYGKSIVSSRHILHPWPYVDWTPSLLRPKTHDFSFVLDVLENDEY